MAYASLALAGCTVGPDYTPPAVTLASFHNAEAVAARQAPPPPALVQWWAGFDDPILQQLITRAMAENLDIAAALARVSQARATAQAAGAALLPTVDAAGQGTAAHQSENSPLNALGRNFPNFNRDRRLYDVGATASWESDLAGGLRRGREAARAEAAAAEASLAGTRISIAADVADAYFQIRGDQARLAVAEQQVGVDAHLRDLILQLRSRGLANERELAQAEAVLQQAQASLPPLRIDREAQLNRLDILLGAQPGASASELAAPRPIPAIPGIGDTGTPTDFLRRRPDIIAAERQLAAANAGIGAALADYYPTLSLSGLLGFESLSANHLLTSASFQATGTGAIRWRIFDFGKIDAEVKQARGAEAEALARYRQAVLRAAEDVEDAFITLTQTEQRTANLTQEVAALTKARNLSQQAFSSGTIPLTDVLDADRQLLVAQDDLELNRANAARAAVRSFRALGGGWAP